MKKNSNDTFGNRTRDLLPTCSAVPQRNWATAYASLFITVRYLSLLSKQGGKKINLHRLKTFSFVILSTIFLLIYSFPSPIVIIYYHYLFSVSLRPNGDHGHLILEVSSSHTTTPSQSVGLLWTREQPVAETST